jgi:hypothetical protein
MADLAKIRAEKGEILPLLKQQMLLDQALPGDRDHRVLHVSDLVHPGTCWRAVTARMLGRPLPGQPFSFLRENIFAEGTLIHAKWQHRMRRTRRLYGQWACRICNATCTGLEPAAAATACAAAGITHLWEYQEVPFWHEPLLLAGHADGIIGTAIIELKSVGAGTIRHEAPGMLAAATITCGGRDILDLDGLWAGIRRPFPSHVRQGNLYCWLAAQAGLPADHVVFLYEFKPNQQVREFTIRPSRDITSPMLTRAADIAAAVRRGQLLPCPHGGCGKCEGTDADDTTPAGTPGRPRQPASRPETARARHRHPARLLVTAAPRRAAADPPETPLADRRRADGPVPAGQPVAQVPAAATGDGRSRRVIRRGSRPQR